MSFVRIPKRVPRSKMLHTMSKSAGWVLIGLADCLESKDDCGKVSVPKLCEITGLSRRAVQIGLSELTESGLIKRDQSTGEYRFILESGAHSDAQGGAQPCAGGRTVVRDGAHSGAQSRCRNKEVPRTYNQEPIHQEDARPSIKQRQVDFEGNTYRIGEVATMITDRAKWPKGNIDPRAGLMIEGVLAAMHNGDMGDDAKADPIGTLGIAMRNHTRLQEKSGEADRFVGLLGNWLEKQYGNWVDARGMPFSEMGVSHVG